VGFSETTDADKFDMVLELVAGIGRILFKLFQHPSLAIVKSAGLIMKSIIEVGGGVGGASCYKGGLTAAHPRYMCSFIRMYVCTYVMVVIGN